MSLRITFTLRGTTRDEVVTSLNGLRELFLTTPEEREHEFDDLPILIWPPDEEPIPIEIKLAEFLLFFDNDVNAANFDHQIAAIMTYLKQYDDARRASRPT